MGFGDFDKECLRVCFEVLQNYDPRNPVYFSKERRFHEFGLVLFFECMVPTLQGIIVGKILSNLFVSDKHTSQRSNQRYLCKNKRRRRTIKQINQISF